MSERPRTDPTGGALQSEQVSRLSARDRVQRDRGVERGEPPVAIHGERQQVEIGQLPRTVETAGVGDAGVVGEGDVRAKEP